MFNPRVVLWMLAAYALHFRLLYLGRDGSDNAPGYLVLYGEKVGQVSVVALSPYMRAPNSADNGLN
jgi:hypothetical protein